MFDIREQYKKEVVPSLTKQFGYKNQLQVPRLAKVVVNMGLGEATANAKVIDSGVKELVSVGSPTWPTTARMAGLRSQRIWCACVCPSGSNRWHAEIRAVIDC